MKREPRQRSEIHHSTGRYLWMRPTGHFGSNLGVKRRIHAELVRSFDIRAAIDDDPLIVHLWADLGIDTTLVPRWEGW